MVGISACYEKKSHTSFFAHFCKNTALSTGSSGSFFTLPHKQRGYISAAYDKNAKSYKIIKKKLISRLTTARVTGVLNRNGLFRGNTVVVREKDDKELHNCVGTSSNVTTQVTLVSIDRECIK